MILASCLAINLLPATLMDNYPRHVVSWLREACLLIIIMRAGMEMEGKYVDSSVLLLALLPAMLECSAIALIAITVFKMSATMAFGLGFLMCAVAPAILIPLLVRLQHNGYGVAKGIPTTVIASTLVNDIFCLIMYSLCWMMLLHERGQPVSGLNAGSASLVICAKVLGGFFSGLALGYTMRAFGNCSLNLKTLVMLVVVACFVTLNIYLNLQGADFIGIIAYGYMCKQAWTHSISGKPNQQLINVWKFLEPLLFGFVGAAMLFKYIHGTMILQGIWITLVGVFFRFVGTIIFMWLPQTYDLNERVFMASTSIAKGTIQAALGVSFLEFERESNTF
jgi:NhaP-type Na+/H+ or K+/H+ antiporter